VVRKANEMKLRVEFIKADAGIEVGAVKTLPAELANQLVNDGFAKIIGSPEGDKNKTVAEVTEVKPKRTRTKKA